MNITDLNELKKLGLQVHVRLIGHSPRRFSATAFLKTESAESTELPVEIAFPTTFITALESNQIQYTKPDSWDAATFRTTSENVSGITNKICAICGKTDFTSSAHCFNATQLQDGWACDLKGV